MSPGNKPQPLTAPVLTHSRMEWDKDHPNGFIHTDKKKPNGDDLYTIGFVRGSNLAIGFTVEIQKNNKKKYWTGAIYQGPDWGPNGEYWTFKVMNVNNQADLDQDDTLTTTVTNTSEQTSNTVPVDPQPAEIP
jgi:hypothetical protein